MCRRSRRLKKEQRPKFGEEEESFLDTKKKKSITQIQYIEMEMAGSHCHSPWQRGHRSITKGIQVSDYNESNLECERHTKYLHGPTEDGD